MTSWRTIDGRLQSIEFEGDACSRFPLNLIEQVITDFSTPGDVVLDPFAGFGTTLIVAERLSRKAIGFEPDPERFMYARKQIGADTLLVNDRAENIGRYDVVLADLVVCSPPFDELSMYSANTDPGRYLDTLVRILLKVSNVARPSAPIAVEMVNRRLSNGQVIPLAFQLAVRLAGIKRFEGEIVFCNKDGVEVVPTFSHSYMMVFRNSQPTPTLMSPRLLGVD
jgi:DNA methylase